MRVQGYLVESSEEAAIMRALYAGPISSAGLTQVAIRAGVPAYSSITPLRSVASKVVEAVVKRERRAGRIALIGRQWTLTTKVTVYGRQMLLATYSAASATKSYVIQTFFRDVWVPINVRTTSICEKKGPVFWDRAAAISAMLNLPVIVRVRSRIQIFTSDGTTEAPITAESLVGDNAKHIGKKRRDKSVWKDVLTKGSNRRTVRA